MGVALFQQTRLICDGYSSEKKLKAVTADYTDVAR